MVVKIPIPMSSHQRSSGREDHAVKSVGSRHILSATHQNILIAEAPQLKLAKVVVTLAMVHSGDSTACSEKRIGIYAVIWE